jgi:pseudouridine synthase
MASCGIASRRKCEEIIAQGKVCINNTIVNEPGYSINPDKDIVTIDGKVIKQEEKYYFLFNKPENVLCSAGDSRGRKTVYDYFKDIDARLFTVGRLDYKTSGIIIVTNDGEYANSISHPSNNCSKEYVVTINNKLIDRDIIQLQSGMVIDGYKTSPAKIDIRENKNNKCVFNITIHEGRNRQIRKMVELLGYRVQKLERIRIGNLTLNGINKGEYRILKQNEINFI